MKLKSLFPAVLAALLVLPAQVRAQEFDFYSRGPYNSSVRAPGALLGYEAGDRHTQYERQQRVLEQMAVSAPDRVRIETIGATEEGRVMKTLIISSPANIARIDEIRRNVDRLANPENLSTAEASALVENTPVVVMLSYSVHGYEAAGFEAAIWVTYQLLASNDPTTQMILDSTVVVINPSANPDGHERLAVWYNSLPQNATDEPWAFMAGQGDQPWEISGRYSHYRFDMNRDLIAQSQSPTRAIVGAIQRWNPQVFVDHHSTTEQFFFPPPAAPVNLNYPQQTVRWMETFGQGNAAAFDNEGWTYYTRDIFDLFYPGYYDAWPSLTGATGMTYETDGGPQLAIRKNDGRVVTFRDGIAHHFVASLATLETAATNRGARLNDFYEFRRSAIASVAQQEMKRIVIDPSSDETHAAQLVSILLRSGIHVTRLTRNYISPAAHDYMGTGGARRHTFGPGALVIDLGQAQGRLATALLEPQAHFDAEFVAGQLDRYRRNQRRGDDAETEGYDFYDITAWSLPYTMGLDAYWTEDTRAVTGDALTLPEEGHGTLRLSPVGPPETARSAYVFRNDRQAAAVLAIMLLREGFTLGVAERSMRADGRSYPRGTFVARTARNPETIHERIAAMADHLDVPVDAIQSAFPDSGSVGVGSSSIRLVREPKILVAAGSGVSQTSFGALWHYLETELHVGFVPVKLGDIGGMRTIGDYNVLIIPSGFGGAIKRQLGSRGADRLKDWVRDGGMILAYDGSGLFLSDEGIEMSSVERVGGDDDENGEDDTELPNGPDQTPPLASPTAGSDGPSFVPGAIFRAQLDMSHWLTLGYESSALPVMISGGTMLKPSEDGDNPVVFVGDSLTLSGFTWPDDTETYLRNSAWATVESYGAGTVVQFADDPLFRGFWRGPARLLTNAILIGTGR